MLPPDVQILTLANGHYAPRCLHVIAELGVADALGTEPMAGAALAAAVGAKGDVLDRMLSLLAAHGIFHATEDGWVHTEVSVFLRSDHPRSMRDFARMMGTDGVWRAAGALMASARSGRSGAEEALGQSIWKYFAEHPEEQRVFDGAMTAKSHADIAAMRDVIDLSPYGVVADIAGGRGHLLRALLEKAPHARGILFDQPQVVAEAPPHPRIEAQAGSFFNGSLPTADAYLLSNILHDWNDEDCLKILRGIRAAAGQGATLFILENLLAQDESLHPSKVLDIIMLSATGGQERTEPQYGRLLEATGFKLESVLGTSTSMSVLIAKAV
jgi:hypothetical protein